ncbi:hypothetical protein GRI58_04990 [Porphyrobacter algicida]|uniref:Uncharacterized protein n=1 Tax=Qipengyuania algicida TaxID=1836209 RepID=A0A845AHZ7_9SPHN|nr:hypothetical protein [Qipengyuania algicida]MXP28176.1 hypothetical protein [Qipengyuania algicida]
MPDLTRESDRLLEQGRALVRDNREGGRHRRAPSIGKGSAQLKRNNLIARLRNVILAIFAIWVAGGVLGAILNGIGILGVLALIVATIVAVGIFGNFPRLKTPKRADITRGDDVQKLVGRTELWLEAQRPALPPPAAKLVDTIGVQLDGLGLQLEGLDQRHPKAREIRSLVGEQLPEMIDSYRRIPANLRREERGGSTPDDQLTQSLGTISHEIDSITRQLAEGSLDDLAIKHRYLDYKFGTADDGAPVLEDKS